ARPRSRGCASSGSPRARTPLVITRDRYPDAERGAVLRRTGDRRVAAVRARDVLDQREADAGAADRLEADRARAIEPVKDPPVLVGLDPGAPVAHRDDDAFGDPA